LKGEKRHLYKYPHPRRKYRAGQTPVYLGGLINADGSNEKDIGSTKKNWTHVTSIRNDEQDMEKQRTKKRKD